MPTSTLRRLGRKSGADQGFTLLEVMVAMAILAMSMTSLLASQTASIRATRYAQQVTAIAFLVEYQLIETEYVMRKEGGWVLADKTYEGNFAALGWPDIQHKCIVDFLELPDYSKLRAAKDESDRSKQGESSMYYKDAGDKAFGALAMVWPMIKQAIERSIRKVKCTVYWKDGSIANEYAISTFWADPEKLKTLPGLGGEAKEGDDADGPNGAGGQQGAGGQSGGSTGGSRGGSTTAPTRTGPAGQSQVGGMGRK
ncbi:MAG: prepilin-type N-terminal cleavage/methylation domain-containing protein [Nannocystis sp.]|nr:prepilin-type N-terminal cleavage/methylation domain-containing protein [Nannocystis sp.]MBA3548997.1 prepilin-type N-terminal cleavage/methylation domain-containing protein [Nannocystis sp.]